MISIFDDAGQRRSVTWNGWEFNQPTLTRDDQTGARIDTIAFSTPVNFHTEPINDIVKNGGGTELYNPHAGTRILNIRGSITASKESELVSQIETMQRAFSPLLLQAGRSRARKNMVDLTDLDINTAGDPPWPPPSGLPSWIRAYPLKFTRVKPKGYKGQVPASWTNTYEDGLYLLQYHVVPLLMPDPVRSSFGTGIGVHYEAQFLLMDGGRSFDQTDTRVIGDGNCPITWGRAPMWPIYYWTMAGAGAANMTITVTGAAMGSALVLDLSGLAISAKVDVDTRDRVILVNGSRDMSLYVSGDYPVIADWAMDGISAVAWTNTTNITTNSNKTVYRESDYY